MTLFSTQVFLQIPKKNSIQKQTNKKIKYYKSLSSQNPKSNKKNLNNTITLSTYLLLPCVFSRYYRYLVKPKYLFSNNVYHVIIKDYSQ